MPRYNSHTLERVNVLELLESNVFHPLMPRVAPNVHSSAVLPLANPIIKPYVLTSLLFPHNIFRHPPPDPPPGVQGWVGGSRPPRPSETHFPEHLQHPCSHSALAPVLGGISLGRASALSALGELTTTQHQPLAVAAARTVCGMWWGWGGGVPNGT